MPSFIVGNIVYQAGLFSDLAIDAVDVCSHFDCSEDHSPTYDTGFFDWLRHSSEIVGFAFTPFGEFDWILHCDTSEQQEIENDSRILVYFDVNENFDRDISCDQEFRPIRVLANSNRNSWILVVAIDESEISVFDRCNDSSNSKYKG